MKLKDYIKKHKKDLSVEFDTASGEKDRVIIVMDDKGDRYVINASVDNYERFEKWVGQKAKADIKFTGKYHKTKDYGSLPLIQIKTEIKSSVEDDDSKDKEEEVF